MVGKVSEFLLINMFMLLGVVKVLVKLGSKFSFEVRVQIVSNLVIKKLFEVMYIKKLNLVVFVDFISCDKVLSFVDKIGFYVCIVKIYVDILEDFILEFVKLF